MFSRPSKGRKGRARAQREKALAKTEKEAKRRRPLLETELAAAQKKAKRQIRLRVGSAGAFSSFWTLCGTEKITDKPSGTRIQENKRLSGEKQRETRCQKAPPTASKGVEGSRAALSKSAPPIRSLLSTSRVLERSLSDDSSASSCRSTRTVVKEKTNRESRDIKQKQGKQSLLLLPSLSLFSLLCFSV